MAASSNKSAKNASTATATVNTKETKPMTTETVTAPTLTVQSAPVDQFYMNPENVRKVENLAVSEMIAKIAAMGRVIQPIFVLPPDSEGENAGKRQAKEGNRRVKAMQVITSRANLLAENKNDIFEASIATIEGVQGKAIAEAARSFDYAALAAQQIPYIEITEAQANDAREMLKLQLITGTSAKSLTPAEYAEGVLELLAEYDGNEDETARNLGTSKVWIQKILRVFSQGGLNNDPKLLSAIQEGRIDVDVADQLGTAARNKAIEMPIASFLDEAWQEAVTRGKAKITKKDVDAVKAKHTKADPATPPVDPNATGTGTDTGTGTGTGETGTGGKDKPVRPRNESLDVISEAVKFFTQQLQKKFDGYDDATLSNLATKADALHNLMIKGEQAAKEEPAKADAIAPVAPVATPEVVAPVATAEVVETAKEPVTAQ